MTEQELHAFTAFLDRRPGHLYMLVDAAHDHKFIPLLREKQFEIRSLYSGIKEVTLRNVAPYLVALPKPAQQIQWIMQEHWGSGKCWSVIVESEAGIEPVRIQLKKHLMIELDGQQAYFRFYDARALERFISVSSILQIQQLLSAPIKRLYFIPEILSDAPLMALRWRPQAGIRSLLHSIDYQLVAFHRQGDHYVENIQ